MGIKDTSKRAAAGVSVALATAGLSSCHNNGAVDPPPPPLECNRVDGGQTLTATANLIARELRVTIRNSAPGRWGSVEVTNVTGGVARPVAADEPLTVLIDLAEGVTSGAFTLRGTLSGMGTCAVSRTFTFTLGPGGAVVAMAPSLPLSALQQARIAMVGRDGRDVRLAATTPFAGPQTVTWSVTGGEVLSREDGGLHWRLPAEAGLYQAELVVDYGVRGLSIDTLILEVTA
jgi:hypothetical protein